MSKKIVGMTSGLFLACLACAFGLTDEPPQPEDAPQAKQAELKQAEAKGAEAKGAEAKQAEATKKKQKNDAPGKKTKKVQVPAGYEDAAEAAGPRRARNVAADVVIVEAVEGADADFEQLLAVHVDANVANLEKRFVTQFTPLLTSELSFIHRACDLNLAQRKTIKAASDRCLRGAVRKYAMTQRGLARRQAGGQQLIPDPSDLLHQALTKVLKETLRPEQQTAYDDEMAKRKAYRKRVAIENVIAIIDERLVLTTDQRRELTESLNKNWQPTWVQSIEMLMNNTRNLPNIPDQFVVSMLDKTQKQVWRTTPKQSYSVFGSFGMGQQVGAVDDFPLVEIAGDVERQGPN